MTQLKLVLGLTVLSALAIGCKDEAKENADNQINHYTTYVDSISNIDESESFKNWDAIQNTHDMKKAEAQTALEASKDREELQKNLNKTAQKYEDYKTKVVTNNENAAVSNIRVTLLGESYVEDEMKFAWVNKDNILGVYQNFVSTVKMNKDVYSREDWDEVKLVYEALDTRKNTVEKEGLSGEDNRKIAALKVEFAPMQTYNRMTSKSKENADAKK